MMVEKTLIKQLRNRQILLKRIEIVYTKITLPHLVTVFLIMIYFSYLFTNVHYNMPLSSANYLLDPRETMLKIYQSSNLVVWVFIKF